MNQEIKNVEVPMNENAYKKWHCDCKNHTI